MAIQKPDDWDSQPVPATFADAIREIRNPDFCKSAKFLEQQMRADRVGAHPEILEFEKALVARMRNLGVPMFAHCVMRGQDAQNQEFADGTSNAKWGESPHNFGLGVDIIHGTRAWSIPRKAWEVVGHVGKELAVAKSLPVEWGGDWKTKRFPEGDPAHWQLKNWRVRKDERA